MADQQTVNPGLGLRSSDMEYIKDSMAKLSEIKKGVIFGSRAVGNFKRGADVDIAIYGDDVNFDVVARLHYLLEEESPMPYFFDVVDYTHLEKKALKDHIDQYGIEIFRR